MKINSISTNNNQPDFKAVKPNKITNLAYSAFFTLSALSAANHALINNDSFVKNNTNTEQNNVQQTTGKQQVNMAQSVYTDGWGNSWVRYKDYVELYNSGPSKSEQSDLLQAEIDCHNLVKEVTAAKAEYESSSSGLMTVMAIGVNIVGGILLGLIARGAWGLINKIIKS